MIDLILVITYILIILFLLIVAFFIFFSAIGIIRLPGVFMRLHAATKAPKVGIASILIRLFILLYVGHGLLSVKLLLAIIVILLTNRVVEQMLSRAAHKSGVKPYLRHREDEYEDYMKEKNKPAK